MFIDEAKLVAGLTHPNIVQIFDLGRIGRSYYIAMEYVHGRDLRSLASRAREKGLKLPLDLGLRIVARSAPRSTTRTDAATRSAGRCRSCTATSARRTS